jgi:inner membrane protein
MPWWAWLGLGLVSFLLELLSPLGFYLVFFGVGALAVGALASLQLPIPLWAEWLLFAGCSLLACSCFAAPCWHVFTRVTRVGSSTVG